MRPKPAATVLIAALALAAPMLATPPLLTAARAQTGGSQSAAAPSARPATQAGATRLETAISGYFGDVPGVVSVVPDGDHYTLTIDPAPLIAKLPPDVSVTLPRLTQRLTDLGGGLWKTDMNIKDFDASLKVRGKMEQSLQIADVTSTGSFDEALMAFRESRTGLRDVKMTSTTHDKGAPATRTSYALDRVEARATVGGSADSADFSVDQSFSGLTETVSMDPPLKADGSPSGRGLSFTATAETGQQSIDGKGVRIAGILGLYRWFLAHPSDLEVKAAKDELADAISAALPLFDAVKGTSRADTVKIQTPIGEFGIDHLAADVDMAGVVPDGRVRETLTLDGLSVPEGMMPPWTVPLMPEKVVLDLRGSGFDLAAPAKILVEALRSGTDPGRPEMKDKLAAAILPDGHFKLATSDSAVIGDGYALTVDGNALIAPEGSTPSFDFLVTAKGYDTLLKAVDGMPDELKSKAVPMLMLARGFSKPGANGDLNWSIQSSPEGHLMINGQDMGPLKGRSKP
ncbi:hypothetical protein [Acidimangrovimonas sediminis]|uniref:hypothetical protein n=1 Tax=Acidimangrovimonas sediminis TaxID=2056283 RepID=UPI000C7FD29A|nr:hypothetical protein [Acidimangrovimonas sediminis]